MKFSDKWMEVENILSEVIQSQKNTHGMHSLISRYYLISLKYPTHFTYQMMPKKEEEQIWILGSL